MPPSSFSTPPPPDNKCTVPNSKGKQQVERLKLAVVNLPKFLSRFFRSGIQMNLPQKLNKAYEIYLYVFKIARWLKHACNILDRSHVFIRLAVEKDLSPVALVARLTWIIILNFYFLLEIGRLRLLLVKSITEFDSWSVGSVERNSRWGRYSEVFLFFSLKTETK